MPQLMQLEIGMSTKRYLPAMGTAGFDRLAVRGYNLVPAPPPKMTAKISWLIIIKMIVVKMIDDSYGLKAVFLDLVVFILAISILNKVSPSVFIESYIGLLMKSVANNKSNQ